MFAYVSGIFWFSAFCAKPPAGCWRPSAAVGSLPQVLESFKKCWRQHPTIIHWRSWVSSKVGNYWWVNIGVCSKEEIGKNDLVVFLIYSICMVCLELLWFKLINVSGCIPIFLWTFLDLPECLPNLDSWTPHSLPTHFRKYEKTWTSLKIRVARSSKIHKAWNLEVLVSPIIKPRFH